jgi:protocatechuate 3,4-dioxygenase beta subunit
MTIEKISRRDFTKRMGAAGSVLLAGPAIAGSVVATPRQVEGPFHPIEEQSDTDLDLTLIRGHSERAQGEVILVRGRVVDTGGKPLSGALVDVWQANHHGRYDHPEDPNTAPLDPHFQGWGLIRTDAEGHYQFKTIKPGAYPLSFLGDDGWRCRHIHFRVAQDDHSELTTQMYFEGDPLIEQDRQIAKVPGELRQLLIAKPVTDEASGLPLYRFDIVLQPLVA